MRERDIVAKKTLCSFVRPPHTRASGQPQKIVTHRRTAQRQKYGRIVMTSSPAGLFGAAGAAHYCAAKMGLVGFANALQTDGGRHGIRVNTIAPQVSWASHGHWRW